MERADDFPTVFCSRRCILMRGLSPERSVKRSIASFTLAVMRTARVVRKRKALDRRQEKRKAGAGGGDQGGRDAGALLLWHYRI